MVLSEPVLVGREKELKELQHNLDSVLSGKGKTIFISGKAGSGKTRLINEFLNIIRKREITVLFGWCLSNTTLPYFPFIEAFSSNVLSREGRTILSQPLGIKSWLFNGYSLEKSEKANTIIPHIWKDQAFIAVTNEILYLSSVKPLILVLEDMHWADSASLGLLHYISRAIINEKILVLVTFRSEELGRDTSGQLYPLFETINLMGREDLYREIQLPNLNQDGVREIAENMIGGKVSSELVKKIIKESQGNPLFIVEFLRMLSEHRNLICLNDQWTLSDDKLGLPSKVKGVIMRRIGKLKPDQRRVLNVASVIGEKFNPELIADVLSKDSLEILEVLHSILKSTSLIRVEENLYIFDHAKFQEFLYREISSPLKRGYHERVAKHIENASKSSEKIPFSDLAYHYIRAGNKQKSVKYSLAAGQDALARFSNKEAIKHYRYVLETLGQNDEFAIERNTALEGLGDGYYANCMFEDAIRIFEELAKSETGATKLRAYRKAMEAAWFIDYDPSLMLKLVKKAEKYTPLDRLEKARVLMNKGRAYFKLGDSKAALRAEEEGLQIFKEEYFLPDLARTLTITGASRIHCGHDIKKGLGEIQRGISLLQELGDIQHELVAKVYRNFYFVSFGLLQEMDNEINNMLNIGEKIGDFRSLAEIRMSKSGKFEHFENFEEAITLNLKALEYSRKTDIKSLEPQIYAALTRQYARTGDLKAANHYFSILMKMPPKILYSPRNAPWVALATAVLYAAKSQWNKADESFQKAFELANKGIYEHLNLASSSNFRKNYIWTLELQGRIEEADIQRNIIQKRIAKNAKRLAHTDLQADLIMKKRILVDEENELRLDLVNVGKGTCSIIKINELIPSEELKVMTYPSNCCLQKGNLEVGEKEIGPFQVETIKLKVKPVKTGIYPLNSSVVYFDDLGETKTCKPQPISIIVNPRPAKPKEKLAVETNPAKLEFKSEAAHKAFEFLVKAFILDYFQKKLPKEKSGWRTLMDIVKKTPISHYSMYGSGKHHGYAASELERLGVTEFRIFFGERGRGGKILKLRVDTEKENIKNYIEQYISEGSKT